MLPSYALLRKQLEVVIENRRVQGHVVEGLEEELQGVADRYDALADFAGKLAELPLRDGWPFVEPNGWEEIRTECDPERPLGTVGDIDPRRCAEKVKAAFLGSVCGCVLGKPLEVNPSLKEIRAAAEKAGDWPLDDYISEGLLEALGRKHHSWTETARGRIGWVAPDDDLNYSLMGMLMLDAPADRDLRHHVRGRGHRLRCGDGRPAGDLRDGPEVRAAA